MLLIFGITKKVLGVLNWSRATEVSAVSREVPMTKELLTFLTETQGMRIYSSMCHINICNNDATLFSPAGFCSSEVAHDFVFQLKTWILSKGMLNSFDSWHGTNPFLFHAYCYRCALSSSTH